MKKKRWKKIESIVDRALSISVESSEERKEYVREACDSIELYEEVTDLITSIEEAEEVGFLE